MDNELQKKKKKIQFCDFSSGITPHLYFNFTNYYDKENED